MVYIISYYTIEKAAALAEETIINIETEIICTVCEWTKIIIIIIVHNDDFYRKNYGMIFRTTTNQRKVLCLPQEHQGTCTCIFFITIIISPFP